MTYRLTVILLFFCLCSCAISVPIHRTSARAEMENLSVTCKGRSKYGMHRGRYTPYWGTVVGSDYTAENAGGHQLVLKGAKQLCGEVISVRDSYILLVPKKDASLDELAVLLKPVKDSSDKAIDLLVLAKSYSEVSIRGLDKSSEEDSAKTQDKQEDNKWSCFSVGKLEIVENKLDYNQEIRCYASVDEEKLIIKNLHFIENGWGNFMLDASKQPTLTYIHQLDLEKTSLQLPKQFIESKDQVLFKPYQSPDDVKNDTPVTISTYAVDSDWYKKHIVNNHFLHSRRLSLNNQEVFISRLREPNYGN